MGRSHPCSIGVFGSSHGYTHLVGLAWVTITSTLSCINRIYTTVHNLIRHRTFNDSSSLVRIDCLVCNDRCYILLSTQKPNQRVNHGDISNIHPCSRVETKNSFTQPIVAKKEISQEGRSSALYRNEWKVIWHRRCQERP